MPNSPLWLQAKGFALPDEGGDGKISFPADISPHPTGNSGDWAVFPSLPCLRRRGKKGSCDAPVEGGEKSGSESMVFVRHFFPSR